MTASRPVVLAIQNDPTDPPLLVGEWLEEDGIRVEVVRACFGEAVPSIVPDGVHGLLPLGGAFGVHDDEVAPWLVHERALVRDAVARGIPHQELPTAIGHDAVYCARRVPSVMVFVPCHGGISHNEAESITPEWAEAGLLVLADAVLATAGVAKE